MDDPMEITPIMGEEILALNSANKTMELPVIRKASTDKTTNLIERFRSVARGEKKRKIAKFVKAIRSGAWAFHESKVIIRTELYNGQHRANAIIDKFNNL